MQQKQEIDEESHDNAKYGKKSKAPDFNNSLTFAMRLLSDETL